MNALNNITATISTWKEPLGIFGRAYCQVSLSEHNLKEVEGTLCWFCCEIWIPGDCLVTQFVELLDDFKVLVNVGPHLVKLYSDLLDVC
jgi:hypothetical protein